MVELVVGWRRCRFFDPESLISRQLETHLDAAAQFAATFLDDLNRDLPVANDGMVASAGVPPTRLTTSPMGDW